MNIRPEPYSVLTSPEDELVYYSQYFNAYYHDSILADCGVEQILAMIQRNAAGSSWLDIGAGPTSLFWATAMPSSIREMAITDISDVPLQFTRNLIISRRYPPAYLEALSLLGKTEKFLDMMCDNVVSEQKLDIFCGHSDRGYSIVTAMGVLGLSRNLSDLQTCLANIKRCVLPGGMFLYATWSLREEGNDLMRNRLKITRELLCTEISNAGFCGIELEEIPITDPTYSSIHVGSANVIEVV